jgi:hypothetical protein
MPMREELRIPAMRAGLPSRAAEPQWHRVFGIVKSRDVRIVVLFATIGLLVTLWLATVLPVVPSSVP